MATPPRWHDGAMTDPFTIDRMLQLPRLSSLRLSPDGRRLVVSVSTVAVDGKKMAASVWQVDPDGSIPPRRLTRSAAGEGNEVAFLPDGSLLFTSTRPDPDAKPDPDRRIDALWLLPPDAGEARLLAAPEGGLCGVSAARGTAAILFGANVYRDAPDFATDAERAKVRKDAGVEALLFDEYPIRHWDHYLGPRIRRLFAAPVPDGEGRIEAPVDLEPAAIGFTFEESGSDISPDGSTVVATRRLPGSVPETWDDLVVYDAATGAARQLTHGDAGYHEPVISPDGRHVAAVRITYATPDKAEAATLVLIDIASGEQRTLAAETDRLPEHPTWGPDSSVLYFSADDEGMHSAYRVDLPSGVATRLTADGSVTDLCPTPDGATVFALQSTMVSPPRVVRFDAHTADQVPVPVPNAIEEAAVELPGLLDRVITTAEDGTRIGAWLIRPPAASAAAPAPLVVFVHGGPLGSWNGWHWRWNPNILVEQGYAVLLPDPALSTGYGQAMLDRGWGQWGGTPYTDIMATVDATVARPDIDGESRRPDGRFLRRVHGQLGRGPHGPVRLHRHPRVAVGARRLPRHHRSRAGVGARDGRSVRGPVDLRRQLAPEAPRGDGCGKDADAGDPRGTRPPRPDLGGAHPVDRHATDGRTRPLPLLPRREPLGAQAAERAGLVRDGSVVPGRAPSRDRVRKPRAAVAAEPRRGRAAPRRAVSRAGASAAPP